MANTAVTTAVAARVAANWSHTPIIGLNSTGVVPDDGSAFLQVLYPVANELRISEGQPGANLHKEEGAFVVVLNIPAGIGTNPVATPWETRFEALKAAFRSIIFAGIETTAIDGPAFNDKSDDGAYFQMSFAVSYIYYFTA